MSDRGSVLQGRVEALESVARGLTRGQIESFVGAVPAATGGTTWRADEPYWLAGTGGLRLTEAEKDALGRLWTRMFAGLAFAVSHEDVDAWVARPTLLGRLDRLVQPRQSARIEGRATTVLEHALGGDVWRGVNGIWNAFCAELLRERLEPSLQADLESVWRTVMGGRLET